jgi:hypothetical protein
VRATSFDLEVVEDNHHVHLPLERLHAGNVLIVPLCDVGLCLDDPARGSDHQVIRLVILKLDLTLHFVLSECCMRGPSKASRDDDV